jgi:hypothetical protein
MSAATASWPLRALLAAAALFTPGVAFAAEGGGGSYVLTQLMPIVILLGTLALIITRLPKVEIQHSADYKRRRALNWLPMGFAYAFLYMGRYNLTVSKNEFSDIGLMNNADFGVIFGIGTVVYGIAFVLNGPLTDRFGGKKAMLVGATGAMVMNALMGAVTYEVLTTGGPGSLTGLDEHHRRAVLLGVQRHLRVFWPRDRRRRPLHPAPGALAVCTRATCTSRASAPWPS